MYKSWCFYVITHIITNKNKFFCKLFTLYNNKKVNIYIYEFVFESVFDFYTYHLRIYMINLRFSFDDVLQA
jgi:hypothetical protein